MLKSARVRCPACGGLSDRVVDSREADDGSVIRRRRECQHCGQRYTTYERVAEVARVVRKRSGQREPFDRDKIVAGLRAASKNRPLTEQDLVRVASDVEESMGARTEVDSREIGLAVLERIRGIDEVTYLRFASVYKGFSAGVDFEREVERLSGSDQGLEKWPAGSGPEGWTEA
jgi:transcriptional repressor NrdR